MAKRKTKDPPVIEAEVVEVSDTEETPRSGETRMGRKPVSFDESHIASLLKGGSSGEDIADIYACSRQTLYTYIERVHGMSFGEYQRQQRAGTRHLIRATQIKAALGYSDKKTEVKRVRVVGKDGKLGPWEEVERKETTLHHPPNAAMLIFIGKNELGQSDNPEQKGDGAGKFGSVPDYRIVGDDEEDEIPALGSGDGPDDEAVNDDEDPDSDDE